MKRETDAAFLKRMREDLQHYADVGWDIVAELDAKDLWHLVRLAAAGVKFKSKLAVFDEFVRRAGD
jgi:hypothetical protein